MAEVRGLLQTSDVNEAEVKVGSPSSQVYNLPLTLWVNAVLCIGGSSVPKVQHPPLQTTMDSVALSYLQLEKVHA